MSHTLGVWECSGGGGVVSNTEMETLKSGREVPRRVACAKGLTIEEVSANAKLIAGAVNLAKTIACFQRTSDPEDAIDTVNSLINAARELLQPLTTPA